MNRNIEHEPDLIQSVERFSLLPEDDLPATVMKKTKTQMEVEEREALIKPVRFSDAVRKEPWYLRDKLKEDSKVECTPSSAKVEKRTTKNYTVEDLRRKRLEREALERKKAEYLNKKR